MTGLVVADTDRSVATVAWSRRVLRVGGLIQTGFAGFWLVRGSLAIEGVIGASLAAALGALTVGVFTSGAWATTGRAPRPTGHEAKRLERAITAATVVQLAASFAAPILAIKAGHAQLVLPSIAITIGPLLLWLDHLVGIPHYRLVGWTLIGGPILLAVALDGTALTASTGITAGALLLAAAATGFHDLVGTELDVGPGPGAAVRLPDADPTGQRKG